MRACVQELIAAGPQGIEEVLQRLLSDQQSTAAHKHLEASSHGSQPSPGPKHTSSIPQSAHSDFASRLQSKHHLPPMGLFPNSTVQIALKPEDDAGWRWLGDTGIAVGSRNVTRLPPDVDAVLDCGLEPPFYFGFNVEMLTAQATAKHQQVRDIQRLPAFKHCQQSLQGAQQPDCGQHQQHKQQPTDSMQQQQHPEQHQLDCVPQPQQLQCGDPASNHDNAQSGKTHGVAKSCAHRDTQCCWVPVKSSKQDKYSLQQALPRALPFLSRHLEQGHKVLVQDDTGMQCYCVRMCLMWL